jgi:hypothetical protein
VTPDPRGFQPQERRTGRDSKIIRAATHIHTAHSWDSRIRHEDLAAAMTHLRVDLVLVSDHNTFDGATEFARLCATGRLPITVPIAAEIRTDRGDMIVVLEPGTQPPAVKALLTWDGMRRIVPELGGLLWLPHPYRGHTGVEELAGESDVVEVFNARCTPEQDRKARLLVERVAARHAFGADAHRVRELDRVISEYPIKTPATVREVFAHDAACHDPQRSPKSDRMAAEITNGVKRRRPALVGYFALRYLEHRVREALNR